MYRNRIVHSNLGETRLILVQQRDNRVFDRDHGDRRDMIGSFDAEDDSEKAGGGTEETRMNY